MSSLLLLLLLMVVVVMGFRYPPSSVMTHGAAAVSAQSPAPEPKMPLGQQAWLLNSGSPTDPHSAPPHVPHSTGQHTVTPASLNPSMPGKPLLHVSPGSCFENAAAGGMGEKANGTLRDFGETNHKRHYGRPAETECGCFSTRC